MSSRHRLVPDNDQAAVMLEHCNHRRALWNMACEQHRFARKFNRGNQRQLWPSYHQQAQQLTEARNEFAWLKTGSTVVQQGALRDFDRALKNHFANPQHFRWPTFQSAHRGTQGFIVRDVSIRKLNRKWSEVAVPKVGYVKFRTSKPIPEGVGHGRVTLNNAGQWHISFSALQPVVLREVTSRSVGVDRGIAQTVTHSDGEFFQAPVPKDVKTLQRRLARQVKGSNRRARTKHRIAKVHQHNVDARKDWTEKYSTDLVRNYDLIVFENLKTKNMVKVGGGLARSILENCWTGVVTRTEQKALTCDVTVVKVDPAYTSQRCNACGHTCKENRENQADFQCVKCGHQANADVNAAQNILAAGLAVLGDSERGRGGTPVVSVKRQLQESCST